MASGDADAVRAVIRQLHSGRSIQDTEDLQRLLKAVLEVLKGENPLIRPRDRLGRPGGLILLNPSITTVLVPDLHARTGYINSLVDLSVEGRPILEGLAEGCVQVLCVGDGFHSEARGAARWREAWEEYQGGFSRHRAMDEEMREGLALMAMIMLLKTAFPDHFHFLKGNHENVMNAGHGGNRPFGKYAWEGQMVKDWFLSFLGEGMLESWAEFEDQLPLLAVGDHFLVSHAEPRRAYSREEVIEYRGDDQLIFDFTWTGNGDAEDHSVETMLKSYLGLQSEGALYFGGHRPVNRLYAFRASGRYVQIHNPDRYVAAVLTSGRTPLPGRDIFDIGRGPHE